MARKARHKIHSKYAGASDCGISIYSPFAGHRICPDQPPAIWGNHVDEADFTLKNTCGWRHFRIKKTKLVQGRAPFTPDAVCCIIAKLYNAMFSQQSPKGNLLFLSPQVPLE